MPPPNVDALENSVTIGMGISAPQQNNDTGLQNNSSSIPWKQSENVSEESDIILPRHRNAVKKYFEH